MNTLSVYVPREPELKVTRLEVRDAISLALLELTEPTRDGGPVEGLPIKPYRVDERLPTGPWDPSRLVGTVKISLDVRSK